MFAFLERLRGLITVQEAETPPTQNSRNLCDSVVVSGAGLIPAGTFKEMSSGFLELPSDVVVLIAFLLEDPDALCAMRAACKNLRSVLDSSGMTQLLSLSSSPQGSTLPSDLQALMHLYHRRFNYRQDSELIAGAWTDTPAYYRRESLPHTQSPAALVLLGVWWVDLHCTFQEVWPGRYQLTTRMQLLGDAAPFRGHFDWLDVFAVVGGGQQQQLSTLSCAADLEHAQGFRRNTWHMLTLGEIEVGNSTDVLIRLQNIASTYKQQVAWDGVCLTRLPR